MIFIDEKKAIIVLFETAIKLWTSIRNFETTKNLVKVIENTNP